MATLSDELRRATDDLTQIGCETPRLDAELLLAHALDVDRATLIMRGGEEASPDVRTRYLALLTRRAKYEPVAYILGYQEFRRIRLAVDPRVLIPRPETELLVEVGLGLPPGIRVADIGTGSGAVALALKDERPDLQLTGIDSSEGALAVARHNGRRLRLEVEWLHGDLLAGVECDAVLANLPYVADDAVLPPDVRDHEPTRALFAGADGLDVIRRLLGELAARSEISLVALEIGFDQADAVADLVRAAGFAEVERLRDLAGHERVIVGRR